MLEEIRAGYIREANIIKDWKNLDKNYLANKYIEHEDDDHLRSAYFAALMCRYWPNIGKYYRESKNSVEIEECYDWLIHALTYALKNRKWLDPTNKLYTDKNGPDKVINRCIASTRQIFYQSSNTAKRKVNFQLDSIERQIESFGDSASALEVCENDTEDISSPIISVINYLLKHNEYLEAIIVDNISYQDSTKEFKTEETSEFINEFNESETEEYYRYSYMFDERKLVKQLNSIGDYYKRYFLNKYEADEETLVLALDSLNKTPNTKLYKFIRKALYDLKNNKEILNILC